MMSVPSLDLVGGGFLVFFCRDLKENLLLGVRLVRASVKLSLSVRRACVKHDLNK